MNFIAAYLDIVCVLLVRVSHKEFPTLIIVRVNDQTQIIFGMSEPLGDQLLDLHLYPGCLVRLRRDLDTVCANLHSSHDAAKKMCQIIQSDYKDGVSIMEMAI